MRRGSSPVAGGENLAQEQPANPTPAVNDSYSIDGGEGSGNFSREGRPGEVGGSGGGSESAPKSTKGLSAEQKSDIISKGGYCSQKGVTDTKTGERIPSVLQKVESRSALKQYNKKNGWYINWNECPADVEVFQLQIEGGEEVQGLVGLRDDKDKDATYIHWAVVAPHNNGAKTKDKRYDGCGAQLLGQAVRASIKSGHGGFCYAAAANSKLQRYYIEEYGASPSSIAAYGVAFYGQASIDLISKTK